MRQSVNILVLCLALGVVGGCAGFTEKIPGVYRIEIQQGNVIDQDMIDQLQHGMDKSQVTYIMGSPVLIDPFNSNRWEYIYTYKQGIRAREQRHITLHFNEDERLSHVSGNIKIGEGLRHLAEEERAVPERTIVVPEDRRRGGLFGWFGGGGGGGGGREDARPADADEQRATESIEVIEDGEGEL